MEGTVGFTGTRQGMNDKQRAAVMSLLLDIKPTTVVHGDCLGADADFDELVGWFKKEGVSVRVELRPGCDRLGESPSRAYTRNANTIHQTRPYLRRNVDIVKQCDVLIAAPHQIKEVVRSGTWSTVRRAIDVGKPVLLVLNNGKVAKLGGGE